MQARFPLALSLESNSVRAPKLPAKQSAPVRESGSSPVLSSNSRMIMKRTADGFGQYNKYGFKYSAEAKKFVDDMMEMAEKDDVSFTDVAHLIADVADIAAVFKTAMKLCEDKHANRAVRP